MAANKVIVNNQTILDLTADTVTAATLKKGVTAHDARGGRLPARWKPTMCFLRQRATNWATYANKIVGV